MSKTRPAHPVVVKIATAAEMLDCSRQHVYDLIARGEIRAHHLPSSRAVRVPVTDIYRVCGIDGDAS